MGWGVQQEVCQEVSRPLPDLPWSKGEKMGCGLEEEQLRRKDVEHDFFLLQFFPQPVNTVTANKLRVFSPVP